MKLLFENWREYLKEEETEDLAVELVGDIMYYGAETPEPGRLFVSHKVVVVDALP